MAIGITALTSGSDGTNLSAYSTASVSPAGNALALIAVYNGNTAGTGSVYPTSITGNGLTWVQVDSQTIDSAYDGVSLWRAMGASPSTGVITINFAAAQEWCEWSVVEWTGVDTTGTNGSGAVVQSAKGGSTGTGLTVTLSAFGSANNGTYGCTGAWADYASSVLSIAVGSGFTEQHEVNLNLGWQESLQTQSLLSNDTTCDWAYDNNIDGTGSDNCGGIAAEIKEAVAALTRPQGPFGHPFHGAFGGPIA